MGAWVMPLIPIGFGAFKLYQNMQPDENQKPNSHTVRKEAIVERLTSGERPRLAQMGEKQFEKFVKTNSIGKQYEEKLRAARNPSTVPSTLVGARFALWP